MILALLQELSICLFSPFPNFGKYRYKKFSDINITNTIMPPIKQSVSKKLKLMADEFSGEALAHKNKKLTYSCGSVDPGKDLDLNMKSWMTPIWNVHTMGSLVHNKLPSVKKPLPKNKNKNYDKKNELQLNET